MPAKKKLQDIEQEIDSHAAAITALVPARDYMKKKTTKRVVKDKKFNQKEVIKKINKTLSDDWDEIEIPHLRGGDWKRNFEKKPISLTDKITWVLTVVNIAILISLVIRNV